MQRSAPVAAATMGDSTEQFDVMALVKVSGLLSGSKQTVD